MTKRDKVLHAIFAFVMFACIAIIGLAIFASFNTDCKRTEPLNLCGG